jgi:REP element-mobilizing transposase RayT
VSDEVSGDSFENVSDLERFALAGHAGLSSASLRRYGRCVGRRDRRVAPDEIFHVTASAVGNESLFGDRIDCALYLEKLAEVARKHEWERLMFCLMSTHAHFVLRPRHGDLAPGMQRLQSEYARAFNRRYLRRGALFAARYDAVLQETEEQLLATIRYVALDPVRAGLVPRGELWLWSSYASLIRMRDPIADIEDAQLLELFAPDPAAAAARIRDFVESGLDRARLAA